MGLSLDVGVPVVTVFLQGLLSFLSPCVLPLLPLYIGYLSGGTYTTDEDGKVHYKRSKVATNTLFFVIGVSFTFFLLGFGVSALGTFFKNYQMLFARIGGVIVVLFGLYQLGVFGFSAVMGKERRLPFHLDLLAMSPITALLMGFTFSFAWTPCVGPALSSVLLMAASAGTKTAGFALIGVYTLGFVLPFLAVGIFTSSLLELFKKHRNVVKYTVKVGGILMVLMGFMMFTGKMNAITGYLSSLSNVSAAESSVDTEKSNAASDAKEPAEKKSETAKAEAKTEADNQAAEDKAAAGDEKTEDKKSEEVELQDSIDFTLTDQYGETHTLSDYKGKTVILNFWATWCPPCRAEMPDIQKIYDDYLQAEDDSVVILGIAAPGLGQEQDEEGITSFLTENGYTYPVLMDTDGAVFGAYGIYSYPTTFFINTEGKVFGYINGQMSQSILEDAIQQTVDNKRR